MSSLTLFGSVLLTISGCTKTDDPSTDEPIGDSGGIVVDDDSDGDGSPDDEDCAPDDATVYPGATEVCDGVDNDCDGDVDEDVMETFYRDADGDGFGDADEVIEACERPDGYVPSDAGEDCDDADASIYPGATELCDGLDNDCNGIVDDDLETSTYYADDDGDGFGDPDSPELLCEDMSGYVTNDMDCDDGDAGEPVVVSATGAIWGDTGWETGWETGWDSGWDSGIVGSGSADDPFESIQDGIDIANVCVHVYPGTYWEDITFDGKDIEVIGVDGSGSTTIYGSGWAPVVTFDDGETSAALLAGFTISGGGGAMESESTDWDCGTGSTCTTTVITYYGGGIYVNGADPTWDDLVLSDNDLPPYSYTTLSDLEDMYVYSFGGGAYITDGNVDSTSISYLDNYADAGGGAYVDDGGILTTLWGWFDANGAAAGGGAGSVGDFNATNAVWVNNTSEDNGGVWGGAALDIAGGAAYLTNATLAGNDGVSSTYLSGSCTVNVINSIAVDNDDGPLWDSDGTESASFMYNDTIGGSPNDWGGMSDPTGVDGNISAVPAFVNWTDDDDSSDDDLHLDAGSACIDAGSPASAFNDADGSQNDMGAYGGPDGSW